MCNVLYNANIFENYALGNINFYLYSIGNKIIYKIMNLNKFIILGIDTNIQLFVLY